MVDAAHTTSEGGTAAAQPGDGSRSRSSSSSTSAGAPIAAGAATAAAPRPRLSWMLDLPQPLEDLFRRDPSVQRTVAALDSLALVQTILVNHRIATLFRPLDARSEMSLPERAFNVALPLLAVAQLALLGVSQLAYHRHRWWLAVANRLLRVACLLLTAAMLTPQQAELQIRRYTNNKAAAGMPTLLVMLLVQPLVFSSQANFFLGFRATVLLQLVCLAGCVASESLRLCPCVQHLPQVAEAAVAACHSVAGVAAAAQQLLGLDALGSGLPRDQSLAAAAAAQATPGLQLCSDPLSALVLLKTWVQLAVIIWLPCCMHYSVSWSMKFGLLQSFLQQQQQQQQQHNAAAAASPATDAAGSSHAASRQRRQQQQQQVAAALAEPPAGLQLQDGGSDDLALCEAALGQLLPEEPMAGGLVGFVLRAVLVAAGVLACWVIAEVAMGALLRGGARRFVCTPAGISVA